MRSSERRRSHLALKTRTMSIRRGPIRVTDEFLTILDEPQLEFEGHRSASDPRDGLSLFGAFEGVPDSASAHVVIGAGIGIDLWNDWCRALNRPAAVGDPVRQRLWRPFPSYEVAFGTKWSERPLRSFEIDEMALSAAADVVDEHERCYKVVNEYLRFFGTIRKLDLQPQVVVCVVPDKVWRNCRPNSR